ncbi:GNAT family N-acetyltransferase [Chitinimonas sp. BJYL2]|uniref:GNAT family N-acetyltransferase n=1 Tax=Chitinimonas sp. BJYL2 TaxID=2976696 RepID=UPI0022B37C05|nr:GNAT family N-acetyltransferase [Chitinimonas sp. BJYL2]
MHLHVFDDPVAFRAATLPFLKARQQHLNQLLVSVMRLTPVSAAQHQVWMAGLYDGDVLQAVACCVSPLPNRHLVISDWPLDAVAWLADRAAALEVNAVVGPRTSAQAVGAALGLHLERFHFQNYVLNQPPALLSATGAHRLAQQADIPLLADWFHAFEAECGMVHRPRDLLIRGFEEDLLPGSTRASWLWEQDGAPVALSGMALSGPVARIGPVYTLPEWRGRGYAGALVVQQARHAFAQGAEAVCLYADAKNPISNGLYQRIGFAHTGDFAHIDQGG